MLLDGDGDSGGVAGGGQAREIGGYAGEGGGRERDCAGDIGGRSGGLGGEQVAGRADGARAARRWAGS